MKELLIKIFDHLAPYILAILLVATILIVYSGDKRHDQDILYNRDLVLKNSTHLDQIDQKLDEIIKRIR